MSYQVLARKWRPQNFTEMVGQQHIIKALANAFKEQRLHHAYLFTGTRGVGKTTLARILVKCFNCETGITAEPCGTCSSCTEITEGRYIDLIEVDAASRTKVEDTRELLENVQYMPSRGRFKIYLIDEVHMLSGHSFNALLKTLEEPPEHVKFVFATTDPQKLPVTILSRCLQFNLKRLSLDLIESHLALLIKNENISSDAESLKLLARAADGSMRDALSLLDQAIAYGAGSLELEGISNMLGLLPADRMAILVRSAHEGNAEQLMQAIEDMATLTPDFEAAADGLISFLHQIAVYQATPSIYTDNEHISVLAKVLSPEDIQLYYQIALHGRRDLALAVDCRSGFEMMLLRIMTFRPAGTDDIPLASVESKKKLTEVVTDTVSDKGHLIEEIQNDYSPRVAENESIHSHETLKPLEPLLNERRIETPPVEPEPVAEIIKTVEVVKEVIVPEKVEPPEAKKIVVNAEPVVNRTKATESIEKIEPKKVEPIQPSQDKKKENTGNIWHEVVDKLKLEGMNLQLARHCTIGHQDDENITLLLDKVASQLYSQTAETLMQIALQQYYHSSVKLTIKVAENTAETPDQRTHRQQEERQTGAEQAIYNDPFVVELQKKLAAQVIPNSIKLQ
ncbi:MAG: DNA polymerase III subunit gamma/tau [Thiotrichaceae bacterium]|nr:DNA polymerase III subunit gamma/tau [Thiotrichaceae bacterium]